MFTLAQLTGFVAVAEELHFGHAAKRLHMTQPPLTRQVQGLERELGVELFDRSGRAVRLSPAGRAFLSDARRLLRDAEGAVLAVRRVPTGESGTVALGFTAASAPGLLGPLLAQMRRDLPSVDIVLRELVTSEQLDALSGGSLDLGLVRPPVTRTELSSREVLREPLVVALPYGHLLTEREIIDVADLDGEEVVMPAPNEARFFFELLISLFRSAGIAVRYSQHLSQVHSILALVEAGVGLGLVPESAVGARYGGVVVRPLRTADPTPVRLHAVWRTGNRNPALRAVLSLGWPFAEGRHPRM
ncbi:LysR family transcriptional regulator [Blastococcus saxobsidens]|uniref:Putative transcriptional regulator, LysR family n=1 Tax=Blastococcus saxobsidens (strain DD2) TaxID=1146883 RepID=H6RN64_BLASD|nr:LysR family transcriptional regulator [Blastococcus saxobsidens]CCG02612.1 putative transcriptional regulator, LysR family [Blastococcus saxobsidens DD2]